MANDIVWYDSNEVGAPVMNNAVGSLDSVLNACLVTGFRTITLDSITVAGGIATANFPAGHQYTSGRMLDIGGAAVSAINGRKKITVTGAGTFMFPAPGVADSSGVGGSITAKRSPLGWARPLSSGNVSIYTRTDVTATAVTLRVDDSVTAAVSSTMVAKVRMLEAFTGLDSYTGPAPTVAQNANGVYWYKGANSATAQRWMLVGDSRAFYLLTEGGSATFASRGALFLQGFGDLKPHRSADAYHAFLAGSEGADSISYAFRHTSPALAPTTGGGFYLSRPATQIGESIPAGSVGIGANGSVFGSTGPLYPSYVNNGFPAGGPVFVVESNTAFRHPIRGELPGLIPPVASGLGRALHGTVLPDLVGTDRDHLLVGLCTATIEEPGAMLVDIDGPW